MEGMGYNIHVTPQPAALAFPSRFLIESYRKAETGAPFPDEKTEALALLHPAQRVAPLCVASNKDPSTSVLSGGPPPPVTATLPFLVHERPGFAPGEAAEAGGADAGEGRRAGQR